MARRSEEAGVTFDTVRALALALPGTEEGTSYGTPAFKVRGKLIARLRESGEELVVRVDLDARDLLMRSDPAAFFITDHYADHPLMLVRLAKVKKALLQDLLEDAWKSVAPSRAAARGKPAPGAPANKPAAGARASRSAAGAPAEKPARKSKKAAGTPAGALERLRSICLALPEVTEGENHSRPCFQVRGKTFVMFMDNHHGDGRLAIWCKAPPGAQSMLVEAAPDRFFVPPYVGPRGWVGARLEAGADWGAIAACVKEGYQMTAPRRAERRRAR